MTPPFSKFLNTALYLFVSFTLGLEARTWTSSDGKTIEAKFLRLTADSVTLLLPNGQEVAVPLSRLSLEDRVYLEKNPEPLDVEDTTTETPSEITRPRGNSHLEFNWNDPWPDRVDLDEKIEVVVEKEDVEEEVFVYCSPNYRFTCDVRLTQSVVSSFAKMFEATHEFCREIPLSLSGGVKTKGKYDILLFETKSDYLRAGGSPGSAGVFRSGPGRNHVMVPLTSLGVQEFGSGYRRDRDKSDSTLVHEIVHQLTPSCYYQTGSRGWFTEGLADYIAETPYRNGRFKVSRNLDDLQAYFSAYGAEGTGGMAMGENIKAPALKEFMLMSYRQFTGLNSSFNYGFALVLSSYFFHLDGEGDAARIKEFLKALHESRTRSPDEDTVEKHLAILLDGRSWDELEADISEAWDRRGIEITFRDSVSSK